ncbi:class II aldolase/adducin family protein [Azomonas macrocytogenes]|uniref:Ribulose-5-phosphate 4-epimerase/fuculose-1-phosphate aldolase n=1 Tax=Azomonas macrocytogenes TaxID=69962 RepID=A0A839SZE9_AZOMA|nr:class II aldolase/adducin family protein [Azomonas macrocytogenes]MBB3102711.1 ribulose-5-phosphate 4-epimerase/fuculose-1-phosphate aldolase [Azomonas macrocytogenes]
MNAKLAPLHSNLPRPSIYDLPRNPAKPNRWSVPASAHTPAEERLYRKQRLAAAFRIFARHGYDYGGAGHITVRDPEHSDRFWVNPHGVYFGHIRVSDLILVNHEGDIVEGDGYLNQAAFAIHSELHKARPDVIAAAHTHSTYGKAWSTLGRLLDPLTQDSCAFYESHSLFAEFNGVVLDASEGKKIAKALGPRNKALILQNHGFLTVGASVEAAVWRYLAFDNAAQAQLLAEAAGTPRRIEHEVARRTEILGNEAFETLSFLPQWDRIIREEPDFLE